MKHKINHIRQVAPLCPHGRAHGATWRMRLHSPSAAAMRSYMSNYFVREAMTGHFTPVLVASSCIGSRPSHISPKRDIADLRPMSIVAVLSHISATTEFLYKCSAVAKTGNCLATLNMGRKQWGGVAVPLQRGGSLSNTMWPRPRPTSVPSGILIHRPFGHNRHALKIVEAVSHWEGGSWVPI